MKNKFRESAVKSIRSPKKNDFPISVISLKVRFLVIFSLLFTTVIVLWGIYGRIPVTTEIPGIYTYTKGILDIYAQEDGVIEEVTDSSNMQFKVEGDMLYKLKGKNAVKSPVSGELIEYSVRKNQQIFKGDRICRICEWGDDFSERIIAFAPYNLRSSFLYDYYPCNADLVGINGEEKIMNGVISMSKDTGGSVSDERIAAYGLKELEEATNDGTPKIELMCISKDVGEDEFNKNFKWQADLAKLNVDKQEEGGGETETTSYLPDRTLAYVTVTLEYRRPITIIIPALSKIFPPISARIKNCSEYWSRLEEINSSVYGGKKEEDRIMEDGVSEDATTYDDGDEEMTETDEDNDSTEGETNNDNSDTQDENASEAETIDNESGGTDPEEDIQNLDKKKVSESVKDSSKKSKKAKTKADNK